MRAVQTTAILVLAALLAAAGCKEDPKKLADIQTITTLVTLAETLLNDVDDAPNPLAFRDALADFTEGYKAIKPDITAFEKKYPRFKERDGDRGTPKAVQPLIKRFYMALSRSRVIIEAKVNKFKRFSGVIVAYREFKEIIYYY